jgi:hypothetical protein
MDNQPVLQQAELVWTEPSGQSDDGPTPDQPGPETKQKRQKND